MSWKFCTTKVVKTRKSHTCVYCGRTIPSNSKVLHWHGMWDSEFQSSYACNWCEDHQESLLTMDNEITEDFSTALSEDIFYDTFKFIGTVYVESDGDWFMFFDYDSDTEVHKEYCPIQREAVDNE